MARVVSKPGPDAQRFEAAMKQLDEYQAKVGFFESAKYEDGTPVAYVAAIHEFGSPDNKYPIPARPFMRTTADEKRGEWRALAAQGAKAIINGKPAKEVMELLALQVSGDISKTITQITTPSLAEATIEGRKQKMANKKVVGGMTKPLVESGIMLASLTGIVVKK